MVFYLIGLGLNEESITIEAVKALKKCAAIYIDSYTVDFPYDVKRIGMLLGKDILLASRELVESEKLVDAAKNKDVALLVYGSPLTATTHYSLILKCRKNMIPYQIIHNASILDAIAETGLQLYKFGKTTSMPAWNSKRTYTPDSFVEIIKENQECRAHTLLLVDIGLGFEDALRQLNEVLEKHSIKVGKIIVCSSLGTEKQKIFYGEIQKLISESIKRPFCFIIPSRELHFAEDEALNLIVKKIGI